MSTRNDYKNKLHLIWLGVGVACLALAVAGCTKVLPNQFELEQQLQQFATSSKQSVNTKIDMLWVVDNSSSMDPDQNRLRNGITAFAQKYMQPTWDIHVAAITTDTYLANPIYSHFLSSTIALSAGAADPYIVPLVTGGHYTVPTNNASWNVSETNVVDMVSGDYNATGVTINDLVPAWGPNYAKLISGLHDGPIAGLCGNFMPYLLKGENDCAIRDSRVTLGLSDCLNPTLSETSVTQCVNTIQNDTLHTGVPIISTMTTPNLVNNFIVNLTTGTAGSGSERGLGSVLQMINDNEASGSPTAFFRPGALRVIIFISDEDDQTMSYSAADQSNANFNFWTHYQCDSAGLTANNLGNGRLPGNYCCSGGACSYGTDGTTCAPKTILNNDGSNYTYTISVCPNSSLLIPVATIKSQFDTFFSNLDGGNGAAPNYFVVTITGLTGDSIRSLQAVHNTDDTAAGAPVLITADRADRYINLGTLVGNGSFAMDITSTDYSPILDAIGNEIIQKEGTFTLSVPATNQNEMIVSILHADGSSTTVNNNQYTISGTTLTITDLNLILSFASTDQLQVNFQPSNSF